ncbi:MKI67 FHA domain-interacting nucleolar phosphoprotein-like isoform X1 [Phoenix dactylifera]|uniref:MKI67 FHA domain-interacting nucleolar phosphoprotein-like isoform X1 n=1 Tax=Phoenix dactylifera TaxID=42345 RepID=A0A8B7BLW5_PHODC|nr:MKI67 FHA domain-interacting nucleolar phosphoprotein-like isoform X1 [Phoenix dactylifera]XP_008781224.1 MKI67 FHA domain-interacting nucleolar phosphoprotein-like isoform X1 [Phoenix dactylifera]
MGAKAKKALKKKLRKNSSQLSISGRANESSDFLPLEGGPGRKISEPEEPVKETGTVLYIGHIPHGFYEEQMEGTYILRCRETSKKTEIFLNGILTVVILSGFFQQFGKIKRLRIARNRKTGKSRHYGFLEFENPEVAKVVADEMNNYLLFEHNLQLSLIPPERVHPKLWKGVNRIFKPLDWKAIARKRHNKERTMEEHQRMVHGILKRDEKRRKRIKAAGIDYECPDFVGVVQPAPKRIKFDEEEN